MAGGSGTAAMPAARGNRVPGPPPGLSRPPAGPGTATGPGTTTATTATTGPAAAAAGGGSVVITEAVIVSIHFLVPVLLAHINTLDKVRLASFR